MSEFWLEVSGVESTDARGEDVPYHYRVCGLPPDHDASIARMPPGWQVLRKVGGVWAEWDGAFRTAEDALASLEQEWGSEASALTEEHIASGDWVLRRVSSRDAAGVRSSRYSLGQEPGAALVDTASGLDKLRHELLGRAARSKVDAWVVVGRTVRRLARGRC